MTDFRDKFLKLKYKEGIALVIKNQQGRFLPETNKFKLELSFYCPVCEGIEDVVLDCLKTMTALKAIAEEPRIQLICEACAHLIRSLNWNFDHQDEINQPEIEALRELGWID